MKLSELINGNQIILQVSYSNDVHEFNSRVLGCKDDVLILSEVKCDGRRLRMPRETGINIIYQIFNKLYIWKNVLVDTVAYKDRIFYRVKDASVESKYYNRRGAYRLGIDKELNIELFSRGQSQEQKVFVKDISESGLCFTSKTNINLDKKIRLVYESGEDTYDISAFIIRKVYDSKSETYSYGCKMPEFNEKLGAFIIKEQIKRRRVSA